MPLPPLQHVTDQDELLPLSDEDVSLLHDIVLRAEKQDEVHKRPKKAVFDAYDAVFAERGLNTNHDRGCLRLLFQLVEPDTDPRATLYEKFEKLLHRAGIVLENGDDQASVIHHEEPVADEQSSNEQKTSSVEEYRSPRRLARRNSFVSMYDVTAEIERLSKRRPRSRASFSRTQTEKSPFHEKPASRKYLQEAPRRRSPPSQEYRTSPNPQTGRPRLNRHGMLVQDSLSEHDVSELTHDGYRSNGESYHSLGWEEDQDQHHEQNILPIPLVSFSETQLVRDSKAFDHGRIRILVRQFFRKWYIQTQEQKDLFLDLEAEAMRMDRLTLERQAFDSWLGAHQRSQREEQNKRIFDTLDRHAVQSYDAGLKQRAFTHWCETMLEARAKTEAARRKYIYVKYFNAWHRMTVTQELKSERQSLKAPFQLLRSRAVQYYQDEVDSLERYYQNLTKMIFWRWWIVHAERKAPRYREAVLKKNIILTWTGKLGHYADKERLAANFYAMNTLRRTVQAWGKETRIDVAGDHQADAFRRQSLLRGSLARWAIETRFAPLEERVVRMKDWRIARSSFSVWLLKTRMVFAADAVTTKRTKQNAFTIWNDRLRQDWMQARISDRVLAQVMYRWVIAQRNILMTRVREEKEKRATLQRLLIGYRTQKRQLLIRERKVESLRVASMKVWTLRCWRLKMSLAREHQQMASEFYTPKIKQDMLTAWRERYVSIAKHLKKQEHRAYKANQFLVITKPFDRWRAATVEAKKTRTIESYQKMRRKVKLNLAQRVLSKWRSRLNTINVLEEEGEEIRQRKESTFTHKLVLRWHDRNTQMEQAMSDATTRHDVRALSQSLTPWIDAFRQIGSLDARADQFYQIHLSELCSLGLRRISMKAFGIRRRREDADAMKERHWGKHVRNIFRHWADQTQEVTYQALIQEPSPSVEQEPTDAGYGTASASLDDPPGPVDERLGATQRAEDWTAFDTDLLESDDWLPPLNMQHQATSTPMPTPGYLNTPSKRAARAKALANMSTTPATPAITPFAARLKAGMVASTTPGGIFTVRRDGIGRSGLGVSVKTTE